MVNKRTVDQVDPEWGSVEIANGDRCVLVQIHHRSPAGTPLTVGAVLTPDAARELAAILERHATSSEQAGQ